MSLVVHESSVVLACPPLASHVIASWHLNRHINAAVTQDIARSQELATQVLDLLGEIGRVGHHQAPAIKQTALDSMRAHVPQVRRSAIRVLEAVVTRGDSVSIDVLLDTCAHDADWAVRAAACQALGQLAEPNNQRALQVLSEQLYHQDWAIRSAAQAAIGRLATALGAGWEALKHTQLSLLLREHQHLSSLATGRDTVFDVSVAHLHRNAMGPTSPRGQ